MKPRHNIRDIASRCRARKNVLAFLFYEHSVTFPNICGTSNYTAMPHCGSVIHKKMSPSTRMGSTYGSHPICQITVSYTHLTLPTIYSV